jgi:nitrite reductase/ring-hydroxylating ferredoxin subunit
MSSPDLTCVATYRRSIAASVERVWENVLDWEHLPWLHSGSFQAIERIDSGTWGWRVNLDLPPADSGRRIAIELLVESEHSRYVARTTAGVGAGTEIWTRVIPVDATRTDIEVEFHLPGVSSSQADGLGSAYTTLYTRLWDEDEEMMIRRSEQLARRERPGAPTRVDLGPIDEVRARAPFEVDLGGQEFRVVMLGDAVVAHATVCPHSLGPLGDTAVEDGQISCPWHGYRFDLPSGRCSGRGLRVPVVEPTLDVATGRLHIEI